jgi:hypothetical protein
LLMVLPIAPNASHLNIDIAISIFICIIKKGRILIKTGKMICENLVKGYQGFLSGYLKTEMMSRGIFQKSF